MTLLPSSQLSNRHFVDNIKQHCTLMKWCLHLEASPSCLARVTHGPRLFSQVFQVTTSTHCLHPKQDVAAKQESPENKNEFSPSLSEARGRRQAERMSGCLCIIFQGVMTILPTVSFASLNSTPSRCTPAISGD